MGTPAFIYLASQSPRRAELLRQISIPFQLLLPDPEEDAESLEAQVPGESPSAYVQRVTLLKLQAALSRRERMNNADAPVLCADTTVALGRRVFGKPRHAAEAAEMLAELSGREHRVLTAIAIGQGTTIHAGLSVSRVKFATLSQNAIKAYVDGGECHGKAGSYAVQGLAASFIERISGSYSGIMGLPLRETAQLLSRFAGLRSLEACKVV